MLPDPVVCLLHFITNFRVSHFSKEKRLKCHNFTVHQIYRDSNLIVCFGHLWWPLIEFGRIGSYANHLTCPVDIAAFFGFCLFANNLPSQRAHGSVWEKTEMSMKRVREPMVTQFLSQHSLHRNRNDRLFVHLTQSTAQMHRFEETRYEIVCFCLHRLNSIFVGGVFRKYLHRKDRHFVARTLFECNDKEQHFIKYYFGLLHIV